MRRALVIAAAVAAATCVKPNSEFACDTAAQCTAGGTCQPNGWCAFPDVSCASGQRYGDAAGDGLANSCVGDEPLPDASVDADPVLCGNAAIDPGEDCEDGDADDTDGCVGCQFARCGDSAIRAGVEDCDDGNTADGDTCNSICLDCSANQSVVWSGSGHCYMRFDALVTWDAAAADCVARRGYLVSYVSAAENAFVVTSLVTAGSTWIGLDDVHEANFWWQDDEALAGGFTNWEPGQPNGAAVANCMRQFTAGTWFDDACTATGAYICERAPWTIDPATQSAYHYIGGVAERFHAEAQTACTALGGGAHLATITTAAENAVVDAITGATVTWLGGDDIAAEGTYAWLTGEPFGFIGWATAEPDGAAEDCIGQRSDGWYDLVCTGGFNTSGFMCEIDP